MAFLMDFDERSMRLYDGTTKKDVYVSSILVESQSDLADIPASVAPGSLAYTAGFTKIWQKGFDDSWTEVEF